MYAVNMAVCVCIALYVNVHGCEVLVNYTGVAFLYVASLFQGSGKGSARFGG